MEKREGPPSQLFGGTMIALPTPCGHWVGYPVELGQMAQKYGISHVFSTICDCGTAYIVTTEPDSAHIRREGETQLIAQLYERLPWEEFVSKDPNGVFFYKRAPSQKAILEWLS